MQKKYLLLLVAVLCIGLYFYGSHLQKDNQYVQYLPILGGLAFGLNTLVNLAQSEEQTELRTTNQQQARL